MKKCHGDYPEWEFTQEFTNSDREPIVPENCEGCEYIDACKLRVALLINLGIELDDAQLEEVKLLAIEEKSQPRILQ